MLVFERTFHKDLKTEKNSEKSLSTQKISSLEIWNSRHFVTKNGKNSRFKTIWFDGEFFFGA